MSLTNVGTAYAAIVPKFDSASLKASMTGAAATVETKLGGAANSFGTKLQSGVGKVGSAIASTAKAGAIAGAAAAATAITATVKGAFSSYASYEQLAGGVETLFKKSSKIVLKYADEAYKTAGLSANDYMETITSFSASMITSLDGDTKKAASASNQAIIDMSDNANKMGTGIDRIQDAYQGFAKQNYTMLDNLKLGYGGTKTEMERLLSDAEKLTGKKYDISSFSDITEAIHEIQNQWDITGTTSKEAAGTIEGSINSMKASWQNWLTELGKDDGDIDGATTKLIDSVITAAQNAIPRVLTILDNLKSEAINRLPGMWEELKANLSTFDLGEALTNIAENIRNFVSSIDWGQLLSDAIDGIFNAVISVMDSISAMAEGYDDEMITPVLEIIGKVVMAIIRNLPRFIAAGARMVLALNIGVARQVGTFLGKIGSAISSAVGVVRGKVSEFASAGLNIVKGIVQGIGNGAVWVKNKIQEVCSNALDALKNFFGIHSPSKVMAQMGGYMMQGLAGGITDGGAMAVSSIKRASQDVLRAASGSGALTPALAVNASVGSVGGAQPIAAGIGQAVQAGIAQMGFYVGGEKLATATRSARDRQDGRAKILAQRGVDK